MNWDERIEVKPGVMMGKPVIKGPGEFHIYWHRPHAHSLVIWGVLKNGLRVTGGSFRIPSLGLDKLLVLHYY